MESKTKKLIVVVGCLLVAGVIAFYSYSKSNGVDSLKSGEMIWVKCASCQSEYQTDEKAYLKYLTEHGDPMAPELPLCKKCGKASIHKAVKCEKCSVVFVESTVPNDLSDRCPKCGYSAMEET